MSYSLTSPQYQSNTIRNLEGCLNDAELVKTCLAFILGPAPSSAIYCLTDAAATIIHGIFDHLVNNREINKGDPIIIHFSGHGARTGAPEGWSTASRTVETFCPTDESTLDAEGRLIPGITVNMLCYES
ncbi:hypothetical protein B0H13DRAFT_1723364 [Mycena leptocephala]|nr:hypothetical protein B0H13DRAFT_1723364 [Mycena leptocephala]